MIQKSIMADLYAPDCSILSAPGRGKGPSLNSAFLTPKPPASSVYVRVLEASSPLKRSISVMTPFHAAHLLVAIETTLVRQEIHTSWASVHDLLATPEIATIVLPTDQNGVLHIRRSVTPEPDHRVLYEALGVPMEIIRPVKTWGRTELNSD